LCLNPLHFSGVKRQSSEGTTLAVVGVSCVHVYLFAGRKVQPAKRNNCTERTPKIASVVPPEDGRLTPEKCRGFRHNKVIVKVKVY
jgi:hypothetical protein